MTQVNTFPITREDFEGKKDDLRKKPTGWIMEQIGKEMDDLPGLPVGQKSLWDIVREMDTKDKYLYSNERDAVLRIVRDAMCIQSYMYEKVIGPKAGIVDTSGEIIKSGDATQRAAYSSTHAMFVAAGYAISKLEAVIEAVAKDKPAIVDVEEFKYVVEPSPIAARKRTVGKLTNTILENKNKGTIKDGKDLLNTVITYFKEVEKVLQQEKEKFRFLKNSDGQGTVMEDLESQGFEIDGTRFHGFSYESQKVNAPKIEFKEVQPDEVIGNVVAKKPMIRDIKRLGLYDFKKQRNPILEFGALNWSTLLDGLPGTGKTTMIQMEMTLLKNIAEQLGVQYRIWVIDAAEKDEYYGKTQKNYRAKLQETMNPTVLNTVYFDDVDLIIPGRNSQMSGGDQDVLKLFMDYLAGISTVFRGNTIVRAATNYATNLDDAFRQRFKGRYLIDGPTTAEDCGRLMMIKFAKLAKHGIIDIPAGNIKTVEAAQEKYEHVLSDETKKILSQIKVKKLASVTWEDIGRICHAYQEIDKRFTGRFMDNVSSNVAVMAADFDLPDDIFTDHARFLNKPYEEKVQILRADFFKEMKPEVVVNELDRYFQSEMRYFKDDEERKITAIVDDYRRNVLAKQRIEWQISQIDAESKK